VKAKLRVEPLEVRSLLDGTTLLIGTWNVGIADAAYRLGSYETVLAAMGQEYAYYGTPQAPDIITVEETRSNARSGARADTDYLTGLMNDAYGGGYDHGTLDGQSRGGGTEGVIYNTQTIALLDEQAVGITSPTGTVRQELRYLFRPLGYDDGSADFYVYVGHYSADSASRRNVEALQVRADADALGDGVHILYTGDFNAHSSNEAAERTLLSAGSGQAFDPINRLGEWFDNSAMLDIMSESPAVTAPRGLIGGGIKNRYDLLWESAPVIGDYGLQALPWTYHSVGNNGSVPLRGSVDDPSNTALAELDNQWDVLNALANDSSDHLPVVQEYQIVTPAKTAAVFLSARPASEAVVPQSVAQPAEERPSATVEQDAAVTRHTTEVVQPLARKAGDGAHDWFGHPAIQPADNRGEKSESRFDP
jgi:hypothetical protein